MRRYLDGKPMDEVAMQRLREFESVALSKNPNGYWLAFSGGKDSCVILDLAKRAGVKFEAHHNLTTVDPPELVRFVKTFPEVAIDKPDETMWQLIRRMGMPPRRNARFCCRVLKERGGGGRLVITGVRSGESVARRKRRMTEACFRDTTKHYLNPIIDWSTPAVWEYIRERHLRYCCLYDDGFTRVGCVLCPAIEWVAPHLARWPRLCAAWERAVKATFREASPGTTPEEYWQWWLDRRRSSKATDDDPVLFEDDPEMAEEPQ